ncbi:hypothetical protein BpHYR1_035654, partial [Brachionus plicatilis]
CSLTDLEFGGDGELDPIKYLYHDINIVDYAIVTQYFPNYRLADLSDKATSDKSLESLFSYILVNIVKLQDGFNSFNSLSSSTFAFRLLTKALKYGLSIRCDSD